jgi:TolB-like protein/Tfp pilus assembly protein PilF
MSLYTELKRRNVFRVAIAYLAMAWLLTEVVGTLFPVFGIPDWGVRLVVVLLALGFVPTLVFSWVYELTPEGLKREREVVREASITVRTARRLDLFTIVLIVVALSFIVADRVWLTPALELRSKASAEVLTEQSQKNPSQDTHAQYPSNSIAVLPFVNMSDDVDNEYFSDGVTEEILNALAQISELKVVGRTSSFAFKGQSDDLRRIGTALNVAHILEGSVRKSGNRVRITAQLIKVDDGYHLWSESYDRELNDIFAIQDEIASTIIQQLKVQLLAARQPTAAAARTNPEAYELYLLAKQRISERKRLSLETAAEMLDKAIELDPEFAPAHAQRGINWLLLSEDIYGVIPRDRARRQARLHLDRALQLDPALAEGLAGLGLYYSLESGGLALRIEYLEQALAINPNLTNANLWLYFAYRDAGQWRRALAILEDRIARDPLNRLFITNAIWVYIQMGQQEKALKLYERASSFGLIDEPDQRPPELYFSLGHFADGLPIAEASVQQFPTSDGRRVLSIGLNATHQYRRTVEVGHEYYTALALWNLGQSEEASSLALEIAESGVSATPLFIILNASGRSWELIEYFESGWSNLSDLETGFIFGPGRLTAVINIALAYAREGNQRKFRQTMDRIRATLDQMLAEGLDNYMLSLDNAAFHALAGSHDKALEYLAASIDAGYIGPIPLVQEWPPLEPLAADPRYQSIEARMLEHLNRERKQLGLKPLSP